MYNTSTFGRFGSNEKYFKNYFEVSFSIVLKKTIDYARKEKWEDRNSCSSLVPLRSSRALAVRRGPPLHGAWKVQTFGDSLHFLSVCLICSLLKRGTWVKSKCCCCICCFSTEWSWSVSKGQITIKVYRMGLTSSWLNDYEGTAVHLFPYGSL